MKMDFPHAALADPADRGRARYAALVATAANGQFRHAWWQAQAVTQQRPRERFDELDARIGFFAAVSGCAKPPVYGAFLATPDKQAMVEQKSESGVNPSDSAIRKPNFLGSRYPGHPETLRGMEN